MKVIEVMNGWKEAPHCWKTYLLRPIRYEATPTYASLSLFGFVFFVR